MRRDHVCISNIDLEKLLIVPVQNPGLGSKAQLTLFDVRTKTDDNNCCKYDEKQGIY